MALILYQNTLDSASLLELIYATCVRFFYHSFGYFKAHLALLVRKQPVSCDFNHSVIIFSIFLISETRLRAKWRLNWQPSSYQYNSLYHCFTLPFCNMRCCFGLKVTHFPQNVSFFLNFSITSTASMCQMQIKPLSSPSNGRRM